MADRENARNYHYFLPIGTRWMDNDVYGHINNVTYYSYFDTVANHYLITEGGLKIHDAPVIGLVVESMCSYHAPLAYPDQLRAGLRVDRLSTRSVTYGIAIFSGSGDDPDAQAAAQGHFVHVFVDRVTRQATPIPETIRAALQKISVSVQPVPPPPRR